MQKQFLLAIVLSFVVIYGWQALFPPPKRTPPAQQPTEQQVTTKPSGTEAPGAQQAAAVEAARPTTVEAAPLVAAASEKDVVVENAAVTAVFNTRGGVLKSWRLRNYRDGRGEPLELVPQNVPNASKPFSLEVDDAATTTTLQNALFKPDADSIKVTTSAVTLTLEYGDAAGLSARKQFTFTPEHPYVVRFAPSVSRNGAPLNPPCV